MLLLRGVYIFGRWMRLINFRNVLISKYKGMDVYWRKSRRAERRTRDDWLSTIDSNTMNGLLSRHESVLFSFLTSSSTTSLLLSPFMCFPLSLRRLWFSSDVFPFDPQSVFSHAPYCVENCRPKLCAILNILINRTQYIHIE